MRIIDGFLRLIGLKHFEDSPAKVHKPEPVEMPRPKHLASHDPVEEFIASWGKKGYEAARLSRDLSPDPARILMHKICF